MHMPSRPTVTMRFDCPNQINYKLHNLASKLRVNVRDLMLDGIYLVLRFHGEGAGIPQPPLRQPPQMADQVIDEDSGIEIEPVEEAGTP